ncbi:MAG: hypothetical protein PVI86_14645 [Phycisphaerae bacterium]|jgi:hypothetical protein
MRVRTWTFSVVTAWLVSPAAAEPVGTTFIYQGQLEEAGVPLSGAVDLTFELFDAEVGGNPVGSPLMLDDVPVLKGLFSVELDFGTAALTGQARWVQIEVRSPHDPADTEPFTPLDPRQPLTAAPYALFSLAPWRQSGTHVSYSGGNVGVGTETPLSPVHIVDAQPQLTLQDGDSSSAEQTGYMALRDSSGVDQGRIGFTSSNASLYVTNFAGDVRLASGGIPRLTSTRFGDVGVGTTEPDTRFHVRGGNDASPAGGGYIQAGATFGPNVVIDENEIMARNDGETSTLHINNDGGDVIFGGGIQVNGESALDLGYEIVTETSDQNDFSTANCPAGKRVIGGGCRCTGTFDPVLFSIPTDDGTGWRCNFDTGIVGAEDVTAYAICINIP